MALFNNRVQRQITESPIAKPYKDLILTRIVPNTFSSRIVLEILDSNGSLFDCFFGSNDGGWYPQRTYQGGVGLLESGDILKVFGFPDDLQRIDSISLGSLIVANLEYLLNCSNLSAFAGWIDIDEYNNSFSFANFSQLRKLYTAVIDYQAYAAGRFSPPPVKDFDLSDIGQLEQLETLTLSVSPTVEIVDLSPLANLVKLQDLTLFNDSARVFINPLSSLSNLDRLFVNLKEATGRIDFSQMNNLSTVVISGMLGAAVADIDFMMQTLYQGSANNSKTGKILFIGSLRVDPSGNLGDALSSGTGQGWITGLIDDYGWVVTQ